MTLDDEERLIIKSYLLGELDLQQQQQVEQRLLSDDEFFEALLIAEDEIIDQYLSGSLTSPERERFTTLFLSTPERRQKLNFARALRKYIEVSDLGEGRTPKAKASSPASWKLFLPTFLRRPHPAVGFSLATVLLLLVGGVAWIAVMNLRTQTHEVEDPNAVLAVTLMPGAVRDAGEWEKISIGEQVKSLRLELKLPADEYQSYRATLRPVGGRDVFTAEALKVQTDGPGKVIVVNIPARGLGVGDYQLNLSGLDINDHPEGVGSYYFRVTKSSP